MVNEKEENYMDTNISKKEQIRKERARHDSGATRQNGKLFFEMSKVVESPEMLKGWVEWFRRLHIPCAIAKTDGGYTLWRKGVEVGRKRSEALSVLIKKNIVYSCGLAGRELNLLKEEQQEETGDSSGGFENQALRMGRDMGEARLDTASP